MGEDWFVTEKVTQFVRQLLCRDVTFVRLSLETLKSDRLQVRGQTRIQPPRRKWLRVQNLLERGGKSFGHEGGAACDQMVKHGPERINIAPPADLSAIGRSLLWRHIIRRTQHLARDRQIGLAFEPLGQSEIGDPRLIVGVDEDVGWLEVAMQDAAFVRVMDGLSDGLEVTRRVHCRKRAPG